MGFKDLFVQKEEEKPMSREEIDALLASTKKPRSTYQPAATYATETAPEVEVDTTQLVDVTTVYEKAGLADLAQSIFKVDEFAAIPGIASLPTDVKRQSVIGILSTSGLSVEGLLEDASDRINALANTLEAFTDETATSVENWETEIDELQAQIDERKQKINDRKLLQEKEQSIITEETKKIDTIVNFVNPSTK